MKRISLFGALLSAVAVAAPLSAQAAIGPVVQSLPGWDIHSTSDAFEGKKSCVAIQRGGRAQVAEDGAVYISMKGHGGLKMSRLRFDDEAPRGWRLHDYDSIEGRSSILTLPAEDFKNSRTVRLQIYTVLQNTADFAFNSAEVRAAGAAVAACQR